LGLKIVLERYEVVLAANTAIERYVSTMKNQQMRGLQDMDAWQRILLDVDGCGAEIAVAKYLGVYWGGAFGQGGVMPNYELIGWIMGAEAKNPEWLDKPDWRRPEIYCVPEESLRKFRGSYNN